MADRLVRAVDFGESAEAIEAFNGRVHKLLELCELQQKTIGVLETHNTDLQARLDHIAESARVPPVNTSVVYENGRDH